MSGPMRINKVKILRRLSLRELQTIVREYEIETVDARSLEALMVAIRHHRALQLESILKFMRSFPERRVKEIVEALGLPATGKRKHALIDNLLELVGGIEGEEEEEEEEVGYHKDGMLASREQTLLAEVPEDGSNIGNGRLRRILGWEEDDYWEIRDALVKKGRLAVGYGRGGSVYRLLDEGEDEDEDEDENEHRCESEEDDIERYPDEYSLYEGVREMLSKNWQQLFPGFPAPRRRWVDSSPRQGRRETGGRWTRPDLSAVTINKYRYVPGSHLDVFTFEVKPRGQLNILGLYEAMGHSRRSNFAYVLYHIPPNESLSPAELEKHRRQIEEIRREAIRLKVGMATFEDPAEAETWTVHVAPGRHGPEARLLNEFIENLPDPIRQEIEFSIRN